VVEVKVSVDESVGVGLKVTVGVDVAVAVGVTVGVELRVGVGVTVGDRVGVGELVIVKVKRGVKVFVGLGGGVVGLFLEGQPARKRPNKTRGIKDKIQRVFFMEFRSPNFPVLFFGR
jgi:UDP-3-O-[3-hydroxymyristoyl] glucosamine N-acyltransferase